MHIRTSTNNASNNIGPAVRSCSLASVRMYSMAPLYELCIYARIHARMHVPTVR